MFTYVSSSLGAIRNETVSDVYIRHKVNVSTTHTQRLNITDTFLLDFRQKS